MKDKKIKGKSNKKILIAVTIALVLIIAVVVTIVVITKSNSNGELVNNGGNNNEVTQNVKVTGKLKEYITSLTNNYYIKYSGNFKNNAGETTNAIVEYTKKGEDYALRASALDIQLICEENTLYSISHTYKMIVKMSKYSFDITEYNLASDFDQTFVKSYKETRNATEYDVEEYTFNGNSIKYYFKDADLKYIKYNTQEISVIRLEKNTNTELFVKPNGYSNV